MLPLIVAAAKFLAPIVASAVIGKGIDAAMPKYDMTQPQPIPGGQDAGGMDINALVGPKQESKLDKLQIRKPFEGEY